MRRVALLFVMFATAAIAVVPAVHASPVQRRILALYKSSDGDTAARNQTMSLLEQPLESLGLVVDYYDADKFLPSDADMERYRGVVTFFREPRMVGAGAYAGWMRRQIEAGREYVVFGDYGAFQDAKSKAYLPHAQVNAAFNALGFRFDGFGTNDPARIRLVSADKDMMSFEEPFTEKSAGSYVKIRALNSSATAYLTLNRTDLEDGLSQPVAVTRAGGYAAADALLYEYSQGGLLKQRWHLNPYKFLSAALGLANEPRFDAASLNGRRLWMAHIDGDGFLSPADAGRLCGQAMLDEVLSKFALPVSVSIISDDLGRDARALPMARKIFALSNVEPASHSASHPVDWTAKDVDIQREVAGSVNTLNEKAAPADKKIKLIAWSSLCNPTAAALRAAEALGLANINGFNGDSGFVNRFDKLYPSRTHLGPMVLNVGGMLQFNERSANDFEYTNSWNEQSRGGFRSLLETFERTAASPERPAHVYFHFYSAHAAEALESLLAVFTWSERHDLSRVFVGDYVRLVEDFRSASVSRENDGRYRVRNAGQCRTVVFPDATKHVDMAASTHVLGYTPRLGALYVFLDGANEHVIKLSDKPSEGMRLISAGGWVDDWKTADASATFQLRAFGNTQISLTAPSGYYRLTARPLGSETGQREFTTVVRASKGTLTFDMPATGRDAVTIERSDRSGALASAIRFPMLALSLAAFPLWFFVRARRRLGQ